jgi:hypothetical protein
MLAPATLVLCWGNGGCSPLLTSLWLSCGGGAPSGVGGSRAEYFGFCCSQLLRWDRACACSSSGRWRNQTEGPEEELGKGPRRREYRTKATRKIWTENEERMQKECMCVPCCTHRHPQGHQTTTQETKENNGEQATWTRILKGRDSTLESFQHCLCFCRVAAYQTRSNAPE